MSNNLISCIFNKWLKGSKPASKDTQIRIAKEIVWETFAKKIHPSKILEEYQRTYEHPDIISLFEQYNDQIKAGADDFQMIISSLNCFLVGNSMHIPAKHRLNAARLFTNSMVIQTCVNSRCEETTDLVFHSLVNLMIGTPEGQKIEMLGILTKNHFIYPLLRNHSFLYGDTALASPQQLFNRDKNIISFLNAAFEGFRLNDPAELERIDKILWKTELLRETEWTEGMSSWQQSLDKEKYPRALKLAHIIKKNCAKVEPQNQNQPLLIAEE